MRLQGKAQRRRELCWIPASRPPNTRQPELRMTTGGYWVGDCALCLQWRLLLRQTKVRHFRACLSYEVIACATASMTELTERQLHNPVEMVGLAFHRQPRTAMERRPYRVMQLPHFENHIRQDSGAHLLLVGFSEGTKRILAVTRSSTARVCSACRRNARITRRTFVRRCGPMGTSAPTRCPIPTNYRSNVYLLS